VPEEERTEKKLLIVKDILGLLRMSQGVTLQFIKDAKPGNEHSAETIDFCQRMFNLLDNEAYVMHGVQSKLNYSKQMVFLNFLEQMCKAQCLEGIRYILKTIEKRYLDNRPHIVCP